MDTLEMELEKRRRFPWQSFDFDVEESNRLMRLTVDGVKAFEAYSRRFSPIVDVGPKPEFKTVEQPSADTKRIGIISMEYDCLDGKVEYVAPDKGQKQPARLRLTVVLSDAFSLHNTHDREDHYIELRDWMKKIGYKWTHEIRRAT